MIKDVKFVGPAVGLEFDLKLGDLVRVRYRDTGSYESGYAEETFTGFISKVPVESETEPGWMLCMWCIETASTHILSPKLDIIEVISESR